MKDYKAEYQLRKKYFKEYGKKRYQGHKKEYNERSKLWARNHPEKSKEINKRCRDKHRKEYNLRVKEYSKRKREETKLELFKLLGGQCMNPYGLHDKPFTDIRCLQIDHVHGGGVKELHSITNRWQYHLKILREIQAGSKDYQLLCANCNWIKKVENHEGELSCVKLKP